MTPTGNFGERQEAGTADWGYLAHRSIYEFAARHAPGQRCLDIGCGTGYGVEMFLRGGARAVVAIDKDEAGLGALRRRHPQAAFLARDLDLEGLALAPASVDFAFSSNVFEHLAYPDRVLADVATALVDDGIAVVAVPPVATVGMLAENAKNIFHIHNIPPWAWATKLRRYFHDVVAYRHWVRPERLAADGGIMREDPRGDDFVFEPAGEPAPGCCPETITAIFVARGPRRPPLERSTRAEECPAEWRAAKVEADARQEMVVDLKRQMADVEAWATDNRVRGTDPAFIIESVCRQLRFLTGRSAAG